MFWVLSMSAGWGKRMNYSLLKTYVGYKNENCSTWSYWYAFDGIKKASTASVCSTFRLALYMGEKKA